MSIGLPTTTSNVKNTISLFLDDIALGAVDKKNPKDWGVRWVEILEGAFPVSEHHKLQTDNSYAISCIDGFRGVLLETQHPFLVSTLGILDKIFGVTKSSSLRANIAIKTAKWLIEEAGVDRDLVIDELTGTREMDDLKKVKTLRKEINNEVKDVARTKEQRAKPRM